MVAKAPKRKGREGKRAKDAKAYERGLAIALFRNAVVFLLDSYDSDFGEAFLETGGF